MRCARARRPRRPAGGPTACGERAGQECCERPSAEGNNFGPRAPSAPLHAVPPPQAAGTRARPRAGRRRAVSKTSVRRERRGRMVSSLCELPAHTLLAAAPRSQPPARARPRAAALALRRFLPSRGADLALGYRFRPPLFARARLPARASHRRWSPIGIRRCSSTPHPVNYASLRPKLIAASAQTPLVPGAGLGAPASAERGRRVLGDVIMQRANKLA